MPPPIHPRWDKPVFVASMGRSGSTLLQRVLNVHPELTIWGEHGAFLKGIVESYGITTNPAIRHNLTDGYENRSMVIGELSDTDTFKPWVSPFLPDDMIVAVRQMILELFTKDLSADIRWGFKEIRYTHEELGPLMELFPSSHLVILARDVPGYAMSRFFAFGQSDFDLQSDEGRSAASARLSNMIGGWIRRYQGLLELGDRFPERTSIVAYSDLVSGSDRPQRLFEELGESIPSTAAIEAVMGSKAGSSFRHNEAARANRDRLVDIVANAEYDRVEYDRLAGLLGVS